MVVRTFCVPVVCLFFLISCGSVDERHVCLPAFTEGVEDLSLVVASDLPGVWPSGMQAFVLRPTQRIGPGAFNRDLVLIDEHTATQWDAPAHFIPPEDSGLPNAGPMGAFTADKVPVWQFVGEACVLDVSEHVDDAAPGASFLITRRMVQDWEAKHRDLGPGDVFVFRSSFSDRYYKAFPAGYRFAYEPISGSSPAWPGPTPECLEYLASRGVWAAGSHGVYLIECLTGIGELLGKDAFFVFAPIKLRDAHGGYGRAIALY